MPTRHALERWRERIDPRASDGAAVIAVCRLRERGIAIPLRLASRRWRGRGEAIRTKYSARYLFTPRAIGIAHGDVVVTVIESDVEDLATVLVWLMTGLWLEDAA